MATSVQIRQKIADVIAKRSRIDQDLSSAETKKATKEAEAADKTARASRTNSQSTANMYLRQADTARKAALDEGKKVADLSKKRAAHSKEEARLNRDLTEALKREAATDKREADKARKAREQEDRKRETERKAAERRTQQDRVRADQQQRAESLRTEELIAATEGRLSEQIESLRNPQNESLRILYATASPDGDLRVSQEIRRVKIAVATALHRDSIDIEHAPDVTPSDLLDHLTRFQPHVIHFSGHANGDVLVFDDGTLEGGERVIPISLFMDAVSAPDQKPSLVVLNACESAENLEALLGGVPLAIGMAASVGDADAIVFATRFYRAVADGQTVESALTISRVEMQMNGLPDHDLPTIVAAPGVDPSDVRLVLPS